MTYLASRRAVAVWSLSALSLWGCADSADVIIKTVAGEEITAADIDAAPASLLPAAPLGLVHVTAAPVFQSYLGQAALKMTEARLPVPAAANFLPTRDLQEMFIGFYAMAGVDFVGVAIGTFDVPAIQRAAQASAVTPLGTPLVATQYTGRTLYTSGNIGFVTLTSRTVLFGDETGMRRALDRIEAGIFRDEIPPASRQLLATPGAPMAAVFDVAGDPTVSAAAATYPFLSGLTAARLLGNFEAPGLNVVGTLTYATDAGAASGAQSIQQLGAVASAASLLGAVLGMPQPLRKLDARPTGRNLELAMSADANTAGQLLNQLATVLGTVPVWSAP